MVEMCRKDALGIPKAVVRKNTLNMITEDKNNITISPWN